MNLLKAAAFAAFFVIVCFLTLSIVVAVAQTAGVDVGSAYPGVDSFLTFVKGTF